MELRDRGALAVLGLNRDGLDDLHQKSTQQSCPALCSFPLENNADRFPGSRNLLRTTHKEKYLSLAKLIVENRSHRCQFFRVDLSENLSPRLGPKAHTTKIRDACPDQSPILYLDARLAGAMTRGHVAVHLTHGVVDRGGAELLVHVVGIRARVVSQPTRCIV